MSPSMHVEQIPPEIAENLCRKITKDIPEYFGLPECNEKYVNGLKDNINFAVKHQGIFVGLLSLAFPYPESAQIYWLGMLRQYQGQGLGKLLINAAAEFAREKGASLLSVETLSKQHADNNYLKTYEFYERIGFKPMFNLKPQGYEWTMVYMGLELSLFPTQNILPSSPCSIKNVSHYKWGEGCDGWRLKKDGRFTVISECVPPQSAEKKHYHKITEQFFYCLSGTLSIEIEGQSYTLSAHDGITLKAGQAHKIQNISDEPTTFLVISQPDSQKDRVDLE